MRHPCPRPARSTLFWLVLLLHATTAATASVVLLPGAAQNQSPTAPEIALPTWELPEGLLVVDRRSDARPALSGIRFAARDPEAEWYLVYRPHLARGRGEQADPAAFGHVHFAGETAWVVEVPRARLDDFFAAAFRLHHLDPTPLASAPPAPADRPAAAPAPAEVDPALKTAFIDDLDLTAYRQLIREISGNVPFWYDGAEHTVTTRYYSTAGKNLVGSYLAQKFADWGYAVELDSFLVNGIVCRNIVATRLGTTAPDEYVVIGGHYDSISEQPTVKAPGAEDNASGTSLVVEIARAATGRQFARSVQFVLFDAEEQGLRGSQHFVQDAVTGGRQITAAITADMVAYYTDNYGVIIEGQTAWEPLMSAMAANVAAHTEIAHRKDYYSFGSDHVPFQQAGIPAFLAIDWDWAAYPFYHTSSDGWLRIQNTAHLGHQIARAAAGTLADMAGLEAAPTSAPDLPPAPAVRLAVRPNPFNPRTTVSLAITAPTSGELAIYDLSGRKVAVLASGAFTAGEHEVAWNGTDRGGRALPSGVYLCRARTGAGTASVKLHLVR